MYRFRRLRRDERIRSMMQETRLHPKNFIYPVFVTEGEKIKNPVASMPGVFQYSVDRLDEILEQVKEAAIGGIMLFGIPQHKDPQGVRPMRRTVSPGGLSVLSKSIIRQSISWWMCACASIRLTDIAAWCAGMRS